jgi:hypothetical protein
MRMKPFLQRVGLWTVLSVQFACASGCKRAYEVALERDQVRVIELMEFYGLDWKVQYRIRNNGDHQRQIKVRVGLDFRGARYDALEPQLFHEEILTLQRDESRQVTVPVKKMPGHTQLKWSDRQAEHRVTIKIEATQVFY